MKLPATAKPRLYDGLSEGAGARDAFRNLHCLRAAEPRATLDPPAAVGGVDFGGRARIGDILAELLGT